MAFCPQCGQASSAGATFCVGCGASLALAAPPAAPATSPGAVAVAPRARPIGVTIIGIGSIVFSGLFLAGVLFAFLFVVVGASWGMAIAQSFMPFMIPLGGAFVALMLLGLLIAAAFAAVGIIAGVGVLRGRSWAWVLTLILAGLNALSGLGELASQSIDGVVAIAVSAIVIWYFFQPDVKAWFGRS